MSDEPDPRAALARSVAGRVELAILQENWELAARIMNRAFMQVAGLDERPANPRTATLADIGVCERTCNQLERELDVFTLTDLLARETDLKSIPYFSETGATTMLFVIVRWLLGGTGINDDVRMNVRTQTTEAGSPPAEPT